jgi:hypothetical protein
LGAMAAPHLVQKTATEFSFYQGERDARSIYTDVLPAMFFARGAAIGTSNILP